MGDETREQIRQVARGVEALGGIVEHRLLRSLGPLGRALGRVTPTGQVAALIGSVAIVSGLVLILADAVSVRVEESRGALVAAEQTVNIRSRASANSKVAVTVREGQRMTSLGYEGGWYKVRARGTVGWVHRDAVAREGHKRAIIEYEMKGYGIVFATGTAFLIAGLMLKRPG